MITYVGEYGLGSKFAALYAVFVSSLIFGLFHFVNLATGADLVSTTYHFRWIVGL